MSGLETAASAFAIVGVVDVVLRTGRDLYGFFRDVSDAPADVKRLNECLRVTLLLVDALNNCAQKNFTQANVDPRVKSSVLEAVRALDREFKSINLIVGRIKGAKTTWSKIKYVLREKKVAKALMSLERSKSVLENSLTVFYGYVH